MEVVDFADDVVKDICVINWDGDGDGELSLDEASKITDLNNVFCGTKITRFDELKYFTGLKSIDDNAFKNCTDLTHVIFPIGLKTIGNNAFQNCSQLKLDLLNGVESIGNSAFQNCGEIEVLILPKSLESIGGFTFANCSKLTTILSDIDKPSPFGECAFDGIGYCTLYVPRGSVTAYIDAGWWNSNVFKGGLREL